MAIAESVPAANGAAEPSLSRRRRPWRRRVLLALGALLAVAVVVLVILAGTYQPIQALTVSAGLRVARLEHDGTYIASGPLNGWGAVCSSR